MDQRTLVYHPTKANRSRHSAVGIASVVLSIVPFCLVAGESEIRQFLIRSKVFPPRLDVEFVLVLVVIMTWLTALLSGLFSLLRRDTSPVLPAIALALCLAQLVLPPFL
jgi:hypothetical protein